jgi:hypothetical protein
LARPNTNFELTVDDMELIEDALRSRKKSLSEKLIDMKQVDSELKENLHTIHDLLGRLHNQKEFYRPSRGSYVGG